MRIAALAALILTAAPALAQDLMQTRFPDGTNCYRRSYTPAHLAAHPQQRVADIALMPWGIDGNRALILIDVQLAGDPAIYGAVGYCTPGAMFTCVIEGDGGSFTLAAGDMRSVMLTVGQDNMLLQGATGVIQLSATTGDDRVFRIDPVGPDLCPGAQY